MHRVLIDEQPKVHQMRCTDEKPTDEELPYDVSASPILNSITHVTLGSYYDPVLSLVLFGPPQCECVIPFTFIYLNPTTIILGLE